ncbi:hypothetical protein GOV12_04220 [Candidatus Pacearchaeota archaeon]|nr:hypothetical protein [Candidatus Pacearchaeota archaeon]
MNNDSNFVIPWIGDLGASQRLCLAETLKPEIRHYADVCEGLKKLSHEQYKIVVVSESRNLFGEKLASLIQNIQGISGYEDVPIITGTIYTPDQGHIEKYTQAGSLMCISNFPINEQPAISRDFQGLKKGTVYRLPFHRSLASFLRDAFNI